MRILFRVDSATHIGAGHVMRCITLADQLAEAGAHCTFICRDLTGNISNKISARGHGLVMLKAPKESLHVQEEAPPHADWLRVSWQQDLEETIAAIKGAEYFDWVIVDHYALDENWLTPMRGHAKNIAVIDELADRNLDCDMLICQSLPIELIGTAYEKCLPKHTRRLIGPHYALLRSEFADAREAALKRRTSVLDPKRVFVANGYMDAGGLVPLGLQALRGFPNLQIDVAIGANSPSLDKARQIAADMPHVTFHVDADNVATLMAEADFAIGSGGVSTFERATVGLPTLAVCVADNQIDLLKFVEYKGAVIVVGSLDDTREKKLCNAIARLLNSDAGHGALSKNSFALCDGTGAQKVTLELLRYVR